jgi:CRP/FNR family transcriptional regulator
MKRNKNNCDLKSCSLCRGCLKEWLPALDANRVTYNFKKGEEIFTEGEAVKGIYFILSGKVKVHKKWGDGKELIVRFAGEGDIAGHRGLGKETIYPVSATALEPVTSCFVDLNFFFATLKTNHDYAFKLLMFFAQELQESEKRMRNLAHMQVKERVADALLTLKERFGVNEQQELKMQLSRQDLASFAGTTYETAFRVMNEFVQDGLVDFSERVLSILNEAALRKMIE